MRTPALVIQVLLAASGVDTGRLEMSHRIRADPNVGPCGRHGERPDPPEHLGILEGPSPLVEVGKAAPPADPLDSRRRAV